MDRKSSVFILVKKKKKHCDSSKRKWKLVRPVLGVGDGARVLYEQGLFFLIH